MKIDDLWFSWQRSFKMIKVASGILHWKIDPSTSFTIYVQNNPWNRIVGMNAVHGLAIFKYCIHIHLHSSGSTEMRVSFVVCQNLRSHFILLKVNKLTSLLEICIVYSFHWKKNQESFREMMLSTIPYKKWNMTGSVQCCKPRWGMCPAVALLIYAAHNYLAKGSSTASSVPRINNL